MCLPLSVSSVTVTIVVLIVVTHQALADGDHRLRDLGVDTDELCAQLVDFLVLTCVNVSRQRVDDGGRELYPCLDEVWDSGDSCLEYRYFQSGGHVFSFVNDLTQCQVRIVVYQRERVLSRVG